MRLQHALVIRCAPEVVFSWIEDPEQACQWQPDVAGGEVLHAEPGIMGTEFRQVLADRGGHVETHGRTTEFQPGGQVVETTPSLTSVSVWVPPGHTTPWWRLAQCAPALLGWLATATLRDAHRAFQYFGRMEKRRLELMTGPHWSLDALAVSPHRQRFGLGAVLVRHGLERADRQDMPAYVQTEVEANADFYAKLGFDLVEHVPHDAPLGLPEWRLVRPAASTCRPTTTSSDTIHG